MKASTAAAAVLLLTLPSPQLLAQQTPAQTLDDSWLSVCAQAMQGTDFFDRCQEILNAGPGSGDRRSAAAIGNNLGTTGAQGRAANRIEAARENAAKGVDYEENFGRLSLHVNANLRSTDRDQSAFENGFSANFYGVDGGFDYRFGDNWSAGAVLGYQDANTDFDGGAGSLDTSGWSLSGVLNGLVGANGYFNLYAGAATLNYDSTRNINYTIVLNAGQPNQDTATIDSTATGSTDGSQRFGGAELGYDWHRGGLQFGLGAKLDYLDTDIDGYAEQGGNGLAQVFSDQSIQSLTGALEGTLSLNTSHDWGVLAPYARLRLEHEFDNDARTLASRFAGDPGGFQLTYATQSPDRNYFVGSVGLTGTTATGTSWYVEIQRLFQHDFLSEWGVNAGLRFEL